ncbi:MAG: hypothetical protein GX594_09985 [Pirellulaceae bacterium]|nr:hypothetical protein [Pirellulaceae bacterium]
MHQHANILTIAAFLGAVSIWLMLPRGGSQRSAVGIVLGAVALGLWLSRLHGLGEWLADGLFHVLATVAIVASVGAVTARNPVYSAVWFGLSLLGAAGLFLLLGAQFVAAATVLVYAGAILVTFLFVLMFAQPEGKAPYDRTSWEAGISAATGVAIVGVLTVAVGGSLAAGMPFAPQTQEALAAGVLDANHTARLGEELFGFRLMAVEIAGVLLLTALVGAAVIVNLGNSKKHNTSDQINQYPEANSLR